MLHSDEGMWLYNNPPLKVLKERYNFEPSQEWLDHLKMSSVRFNSGGSGSFISSNGLVLTNHHVGADPEQARIVRRIHKRHIIVSSTTLRPLPARVRFRHGRVLVAT